VAQPTMEQITIIAAAVPVSIAVIATVCSWVFLRFFRIPADLPDASATLILPVTGSLPRLEELFDALLGLGRAKTCCRRMLELHELVKPAVVRDFTMPGWRPSAAECP